MGLGPSIKMTTLHHFNCPTTQLLLRDRDIDFAGVIVAGVSEDYDAKLAVAEATGQLAAELDLDGALVAIDGWGNHHVDLVSVFAQLGQRGIPAVGLSFIGQQGRLVCSNEYVGPIVDFNKSPEGYETCVVGQNSLTDFDSYQAVELLKTRMPEGRARTKEMVGCLTRRHLPVQDVRIALGGSGTRFNPQRGVLEVSCTAAAEQIAGLKRLEHVTISVIRPQQRCRFVNSNLDFMPIAKKESGALGTGVTCLLSGVCVMLTGVEAGTGFQPANIGSSEGFLDKVVAFNRPGTPKMTDSILHIDVQFRTGEGRTAEGIAEAHMAADYILDEIRDSLPTDLDQLELATDCFQTVPRPEKPRVALIKLVSGLGAMYDTALFPEQPGGFLGAGMMRVQGNQPVLLTPAQVLDGAIHSLI